MASEDLAVLWAKGKGLSAKSLICQKQKVRELDQGEVLLRVDKFAFSHMALGYLMKGFTRTFGAYHNFYRCPEENLYRSACWGFATVMESTHPKVAVGTRLYGIMPPARFQVQSVGGIIPGKKDEPSLVELTMEEVPFNLRRFQEMEVVSDGLEPHLEDWIISTKEIYTMAYYMDEQLLVDTGMINCVVISCASAKTALALAFCLRMRDMRYVFGLTSKEHLDFCRSTDLYHEVFSYEDVASLPNNHTVVYMDFKCDGELRQQITLRMGTNLMYNMVIGPAVFQKKAKDQLFEKRAREVLFDESSWRERRRMVAEVTKTGRNEKLKYSYQSFIERMKKFITVKHISSFDGFVAMYTSLYSNAASPADLHVCSFHEDGAVDEIWKD
ncbi:unnamed protein product [Effrenium voratum]|uniref:Uncharacterized protein n=1 Tax=Effrenium voratum TaxID=2562239 RepID=A0AA36I1C2_9DINO|nr:unnamed protein product [Effrenium voratum]CAJ1379220.1 unnamed protein product [Effrenium voratum]CAJ1461067.1 unnamed protein product [Effrenium voratum]